MTGVLLWVYFNIVLRLNKPLIIVRTWVFGSRANQRIITFILRVIPFFFLKVLLIVIMNRTPIISDFRRFTLTILWYILLFKQLLLWSISVIHWSLTILLISLICHNVTYLKRFTLRERLLSIQNTTLRIKVWTKSQDKVLTNCYLGYLLVSQSFDHLG